MVNKLTLDIVVTMWHWFENHASGIMEPIELSTDNCTKIGRILWTENARQVEVAYQVRTKGLSEYRFRPVPIPDIDLCLPMGFAGVSVLGELFGHDEPDDEPTTAMALIDTLRSRMYAYSQSCSTADTATAVQLIDQHFPRGWRIYANNLNTWYDQTELKQWIAWLKPADPAGEVGTP